MSDQQHFSNADTGSKPADPYKEANKDDAPVPEKIDALSTLVTKCKFGMMVTRDSQTGHLVSRCMALAAKETGGIDLLFYTNTETGKTDELAADPHVNMSFLNSSGEWASVSGTASIITDRSMVKQHYSSTLKAWLGDLGDGVHNGGPEDPRLGIIRVNMNTATFAINDKNVVSRVAEVVQGEITGKPASVNKLRKITDTEVQQWRAMH